MLRIDHQTNESIKRVRDELANHLKKNEGLTLENLEIVNIANRSFSTIVFLNANTSKGTQRMVMKKVVHDPINMAITKKENQAVVEFEILEKLYPQFNEVEGCAVPRPILVIPEMEVFVMDYVEGRFLSEELKYARYFTSQSKFERLQRYYYLCGKWLRSFQEFTGFKRNGVKAFDGIHEKCHIRLKLIEETGNHRCPKGFRSQIMNLLENQLSKIGERDVITSGRHGDFGHWNIMVNSNGVIIFDFLGYALEPIPYDPLKMFISFETWKNHPAYNNKRLDHLKNCFIEGYGNFRKIPLPVAIICESYHRISNIYACLSNPGNRLDQRLKTKRTLIKNMNALGNVSNGNIIWPSIY